MSATSEKAWSASDVANQLVQQAVVSGADSGVVLLDAAGAGVSGRAVTATSRKLAKGKAAAAAIAAAAPAAHVVFEELDLASLASIRAFAERTGL